MVSNRRHVPEDLRRTPPFNALRARALHDFSRTPLLAVDRGGLEGTPLSIGEAHKLVESYLPQVTGTQRAERASTEAGKGGGNRKWPTVLSETPARIPEPSAATYDRDLLMKDETPRSKEAIVRKLLEATKVDGRPQLPEFDKASMIARSVGATQQLKRVCKDMFDLPLE